jgi:glucose-1-phosphate cytidylyltransferase
MKVIILAGGFGTRISEESVSVPKPMIEIGGMPILWHIMKTYSYYGFNDFVICAGYRQDYIKDYFANYYLRHSDITFDLKTNTMQIHQNCSEPWSVTIVDTGLNTMTGGRLKRISKYLGNETFLLTYGDGVSNININEEIAYHKAKGHIATLAAVKPDARFGNLDINSADEIESFREKNPADSGYINGGFMVLEPEIIDYIQDDSIMLEREPLEKCAAIGQLDAFKFNGFWQCMDTMRDKKKLEELWNTGKAPWKVW